MTLVDDEAPAHDTCADHLHDQYSPQAGPAVTLTWMQRRVHGAIVWYQRLREGRPSPCRFFPTCSSYALEAFDTHGTWRGGWLTMRRLVRCRPLGPSGFDPVPEVSASRASASPSAQTSTAQTPASPSAQTSSSQKGV